MNKAAAKKPLQTNRLHKLKNDRADLKRLGIDLHHFPSYINLQPFSHIVDVILLSYIIKGTGTHYMDNDAYEETGTSLGVTHFGQSHSIVTGPEGMEIMNIYLDINKFPLPVLPAPLDSIVPMLIPLHPGFGNRLNRIVRVQFDEPSAPVTELVFAMHRELQAKNHGYEESISLLFKQFLILCCRQILKNGIRPSLSTTRTPVDSMEHIRQHLDARYTQPVRLSQLTQISGLSPTYLCRAFKRHTGKTVFEYVLDKRVQGAMMALRSSSLKIAAIALDCGFNDPAHFNRVFKERTGRTPRDYRAYK